MTASAIGTMTIGTMTIEPMASEPMALGAGRFSVPCRGLNSCVGANHAFVSQPPDSRLRIPHLQGRKALRRVGAAVRPRFVDFRFMALRLLLPSESGSLGVGSGLSFLESVAKFAFRRIDP